MACFGHLHCNDLFVYSHISAPMWCAMHMAGMVAMLVMTGHISGLKIKTYNSFRIMCKCAGLCNLFPLVYWIRLNRRDSTWACFGQLHSNWFVCLQTSYSAEMGYPVDLADMYPIGNERPNLCPAQGKMFNVFICDVDLVDLWWVFMCD